MENLENPVKWVSGALLFRQPTTHNDVFWCDASNSPVVFLNGGNVCSLCGQTMVDMKNKHSFVVHIEMEKQESSVYEKRGVLTV